MWFALGFVWPDNMLFTMFILLICFSLSDTTHQHTRQEWNQIHVGRKQNLSRTKPPTNMRSCRLLLSYWTFLQSNYQLRLMWISVLLSVITSSSSHVETNVHGWKTEADGFKRCNKEEYSSALWVFEKQKVFLIFQTAHWVQRLFAIRSFSLSQTHKHLKSICTFT